MLDSNDVQFIQDMLSIRMVVKDGCLVGRLLWAGELMSQSTVIHERSFKMKSAETQLIETQVYNLDQSWCFRRLLRLGDHVLRVFICRNAYDNQSNAEVCRWDGTHWHQVHLWPICELECRRISYVQKNILAKDFEPDAWRMIEVVKAIIM